MREFDGFAPLAERYDGYIIDLWGVIHDGIRPYPGAIDTLRRLVGRPVVLLSNAPRRAAAAIDMLRGMGIHDGLHNGLVTSGEAVWAALRERSDPWYAALGQRVFHIGPERDRNLLEGLDLVETSDPGDASFVLNTGPDDTRNPSDINEFEADLRRCRAASLPMICANPDLEVIRGGVRVLCAGALAERYQALGGDVRSLGKPDPAIYEPVLRRLGMPRERVLAVGDSLRTDIAGASNAGIASCWVRGGVDGAGVADVLARMAPERQPIAAIPAFRWAAG
jgi:HAD superfamily hydrolase (TIGR01459 family)